MYGRISSSCSAGGLFTAAGVDPVLEGMGGEMKGEPEAETNADEVGEIWRGDDCVGGEDKSGGVEVEGEAKKRGFL